MGRRKQQWARGDVFLVPLQDGTNALAQIVGREAQVLNSVTCAFFESRLAEGVTPIEADSALGRLISILFCTRDLLDSGRWKVVGNRSVELKKKDMPYENCRSKGWVGAEVEGSGIVEDFLNAFHGLQPWDAYKDPNYFDKLLLSPKKKPHNLIYSVK